MLFAPIFLFSGPAIQRCHLYFFTADPCCHGNEFWDKNWLQLGRRENNSALFSPTPLFSVPGYPMVSFKFLTCWLLLSWQRILGLNWLQLSPRER